MISTEEGNENSKANLEEVAQAVSRGLGNCWGCRREGFVLELWRDGKDIKIRSVCLVPPGSGAHQDAPGQRQV